LSEFRDYPAGTVRRMAFNVMSRNYDDHTKNFSFILKQAQNWNLAPAYDIAHAYNPKGQSTYQHLMSVNGKFDNITREDLLAEADRFGVPGPEELLSDIRAALDNWTEHAKEAGLSKNKSDELARDFLPL
jgi:serine/threonine-protein kinase HipA